MTAAPLELLSQYWYAWAVGALLAAIALGFVLRFVLPALRLGVELGDAIEALRVVRESRADGSTAALGDIAKTALTTPRLATLWQEYRQTLHPQSEGAGGARWRATTLAESFFSEEALVDSPLKTEFYKHLPGILTGLGIIGTFTGLIIGLIHFDVSLDPAQAQAQLRNLINSVGHAFFVSAVAISLAMLFTWVEKSLLTLRYRQVEQLRELIDGMFDVGADYEYLERLVVAAEKSAAQAEGIKDSLAEQLRGIFGEISQRQVEAAARQVDATRELGEFVAQQRASMLEAQKQSGAMLEATLEKLSGKVSAAVLQLENQVRATAGVQQEQSERIARQAGEAVGGIASQVERLIVRSIEASQAVEGAVARLAQVTGDAVAGMNRGADTLAAAATDFAKAGEGVAGTLTAAAAATETIRRAADDLASASGATERALTAHAQAYESFAALVEGFKTAIDAARRDAATSAELVDRLQAAGAQLSSAQRKAEEYLRNVNDVLVQAHESFADNVERTLRESNRQFQLELSQAVSLLSGAIQDLGDLVENLPARQQAAS